MEGRGTQTGESSNTSRARQKKRGLSSVDSELPPSNNRRVRLPQPGVEESTPNVDDEAVRSGLPERIFATDRYPNGRLNMGRESFLWTLSTLKLQLRVLGKCDDPVGELRQKLRQKTLKLVGFPLALQLMAFESIPSLLSLVGGDDNTILYTYTGKILPQHAGLVLVDVLKAEHQAELVVKPFMSMSCSHDEMWAEWDEERSDKKVDYILKLLDEGHVFTKAHWGRGALR